MAVKSVTLKQGQTIFDLALQVLGDSSKVYEIIQMNPTIENINSNNLEGTIIYYNETNNDITDYYKVNNITVSTRYPETDTGIYYLQQEDEFYLLQENNFKLII
jgi:hypothetical protein